ncbi:lasso peptide biosynthesis PqqD family chaperone [Metabacillus halosaccharovorans]|uniref:Lasso peptide biosynthesis PqqD family chaperone n=1 Tax=Metabacillus halosaccharovorans TaxID=930124 RepID=A0ABT3DM61_9BACI|nr:lasso peptide biosynthesis PqqD family chaperone [Metabacillus halosaccharovorans]MCV9888150.1 lasso peptide biosynthesis PqqD family chaperone [Metabacillus halosaccharovorans]
MVKTKELLPTHIVSQGEGNIVSDMGGEKVMLSIENGKYYNLGEIGGVVWDLAKKPIKIEKLVTHLVSHYEVEQNECEVQVMKFIKQLNAEGLLIVES